MCHRYKKCNRVCELLLQQHTLLFYYTHVVLAATCTIATRRQNLMDSRERGRTCSADHTTLILGAPFEDPIDIQTGKLVSDDYYMWLVVYLCAQVLRGLWKSDRARSKTTLGHILQLRNHHIVLVLISYECTRRLALCLSTVIRQDQSVRRATRAIDRSCS